MKEPWQYVSPFSQAIDHELIQSSLYNLKRRIASMEPISLDTFNTRIQPQPEAIEEAEQASSEEESPNSADQDVDSPHQCLFCQHESLEDSDEDLEAILDHMQTSHGLLIPHRDSISDLPSFLGYLATQIRVWHECLYCGITRDSTSAIRSHMRDRGHCMLNLDREPELLDFWEPAAGTTASEEKAKLNSSSTSVGVEAQLSTGKVIASRHHPSKRVETARKREMRLALLAEAEASSRTESPKPRAANSNRQLARREEMSIAGIDPQQRQALMVAEKRSQKQEEVATRASEWAYAKKANKQKYDQNHGPLSWAKGGLHQLLPR